MNQFEEPILTILAEGGSIEIFKTSDSFLFLSNEIFKEANEIVIKNVPQSFPLFSQAFIALQNKYPIFIFYLDEVHPHYIPELKKLLQTFSNTNQHFSPSWQNFLTNPVIN